MAVAVCNYFPKDTGENIRKILIPQR